MMKFTFPVKHKCGHLVDHAVQQDARYKDSWADALDEVARRWPATEPCTACYLKHRLEELKKLAKARWQLRGAWDSLPVARMTSHLCDFLDRKGVQYRIERSPLSEAMYIISNWRGGRRWRIAEHAAYYPSSKNAIQLHPPLQIGELPWRV